MLKLVVCWSCKEEIELDEKPARKDECPKCSAPVRCCYNCLHYDKEAFHQCKESAIAEWVRYKEKGNFCEYFTPRYLHLLQKLNPPKNSEERKQAWDNLFDD